MLENAAAAAPPPGAPVPPPAPAFAAFHPEVTAGRLVSLTFQVWIRSIFRFAAVGVLVMVPVFLGNLALVMSGAMREARVGVGPMGPAAAGIAVVALLFPALAILMGGLTQGAIQQLAGRPVRVFSMLWTALRAALPLLGAYVLVMLAVAGGVLLLVVPGLVVGAALALAFPVIVAERAGPIQALRRSWSLSRDHRLAIFLAAIVVGISHALLNQVFARLLPWLLDRTPAVAGLVAMLGGFLVMPLNGLFPAVAYHEIRVAKEGAATEDILSVFE